MLIGFLDDTELVVDPSDPAPDIFVFGGYFIRQELLPEFQCRISEVKRNYSLPPHAPIKWNLKDNGLRAFYNPENYLSPELIERILKNSQALRRDLLGLLTEYNATILISGRYDVSWREVDHAEYYSWAFENLLQRIGLMAKVSRRQDNQPGNITVVADWPQGGVDKRLFDLYMGGYHFGKGIATKQGYFSGALAQLGFVDSLVHGSTYHSGPLQVADLVVGCCRDFISWAIKGTKIGKIQGLFDPLIDRFHRDEKGRLDGCGFKVAKANNLDIEAKIREYLDQNRRAATVEIPF